MSEPILLPQTSIGEELKQHISDHNWVVMFMWRHAGSNCKPFEPFPSAAPAASVVPSRVQAAERGGSVEVRS